MRIAFILPSRFRIGALSLAADFARALSHRGHAVFLLESGREMSPELLSLLEFPLQPIAWPESKEREFDAVIALHWEEAFRVNELRSRVGALFVRNDERRYESPDNHPTLSLIELSYRFPMLMLTDSLEVAGMFRNECQREISVLPAGVDTQLFSASTPLFEKNRKQLRVLIEGGVESYEGVAAAFDVVRNVPGIEVWYLATSGIANDRWQPHRMLRPHPRSRLRNIYSSCDVLLHLGEPRGSSSTILEAMASGLTVLTVSPQAEYPFLVHEKNVLMVEDGKPESAARLLKQLQQYPAMLEALQTEAQRTAKALDFSMKAEALIEAIEAASRESRSMTKEEAAFFSHLGRAACAARENLGYFVQHSEFQGKQQEIHEALRNFFDDQVGEGSSSSPGARQAYHRLLDDLEKYKKLLGLVQSDMVRQGQVVSELRQLLAEK